MDICASVDHHRLIRGDARGPSGLGFRAGPWWTAVLPCRL